MEKARNYYWDNVKAVLIFLVVFGHFLLPLHSNNRIADIIYYWIYLFHMPAFIYVSGVFCKSYVRRQETQCSRLTGFLILYAGFQICLWLVDLIFTKEFKPLAFFTTISAPWYMLSMFWYYLMIPYIARIKNQKLMLFILVLIGLLIGTDPNAGAFLSMTRTFVFFPFFVAGYYHPQQNTPSEQTGQFWKKALSLFVLAAVFLLIVFGRKQIGSYFNVVFGYMPYKKYAPGIFQGLAAQLAAYIIAAVMMYAVFQLIPEKKLFFTYIGQRTMGIYIVHRILRDVLKYLGLYNILGNGKMPTLWCLLISIIVTVAASGKHLSEFFRKPFDLYK